jgi:hypothetical protein
MARSESECAIVLGYLWLFFELVEAVSGLWRIIATGVYSGCIRCYLGAGIKM